MRTFQTTLKTAKKLAARADARFGNTGRLNMGIVCKFINAGYAPVLAVVRLVEDNRVKRPERVMMYVRRALAIMDNDPEFMCLERQKDWAQSVRKVERVAEHMHVYYVGGYEYFHICEHEKLNRVKYWLDTDNFQHTVTGDDCEMWEKVKPSLIKR